MRANVTPLIWVSTSIRQGLRPSIQILPGTANSRTEGKLAPNPNASKASRRRPAFARAGSTNTSRSSVSLGSPWAATAWPPTSRNRTRFEIRSDKNSFQSGLSWIFTEPDPPQLLYRGDTFLETQAREIAPVEFFDPPKIRCRTQNSLEHGQIVPPVPRRGKAAARSCGSLTSPPLAPAMPAPLADPGAAATLAPADLRVVASCALARF